MENLINVAGTVNDSIVDGVGLRYVLFVQGCPRKCKGCHNADTQPFVEKTLMTPAEIMEQIDANPLLDGVTFSGGEPMCQAESLVPLAKMIKERGLHLAIYTGYTFEDLLSKDMLGVKELLGYADILIDGEFIEGLRDYTLKFRGSSNQRVIDVQESLRQSQTVLVTSPKWL